MSKTIKTEHGEITLTKDGDTVILNQKTKNVFIPIKNAKELKKALTELISTGKAVKM